MQCWGVIEVIRQHRSVVVGCEKVLKLLLSQLYPHEGRINSRISSEHVSGGVSCHIISKRLNWLCPDAAQTQCIDHENCLSGTAWVLTWQVPRPVLWSVVSADHGDGEREDGMWGGAPAEGCRVQRHTGTTCLLTGRHSADDQTSQVWVFIHCQSRYNQTD